MKTIINRVQLIGNLGQDVQITNLQSGKQLAKVSLATHEAYFNQNGDKVDDTQWHNLIAWGKIAENMGKLLRKGSKVAVQGKLTHRKYEGSDGKTRYITEIVVSDFMLIGTKPSDSPVKEEQVEDIPF